MEAAFSAECAEQIDYYVYALIDTRSKNSTDFENIFYVGKGNKNRCFQHSRDELKAEELSNEQLKLAQVRAVRQETGEPPRIRVIAHNLNEDEALRLEALLIGILPELTNRIQGHGHTDYWLNTSELESRYAHPLASADLPDNVLLVSLNGGKALAPYPKIAGDADELMRRTLGSWDVNRDKAKRVDYVVGVYNSLIRCVFKTKKKNGDAVFETIPKRKKGAHDRVRFEGCLVPESKWVFRRIIDEKRKVLTTFDRQKGYRLLMR